MVEPSGYTELTDVPKNREGIPLQLPSVGRFVLRQTIVVIFTLLLNTGFAALAWAFVTRVIKPEWIQSFAKFQFVSNVHWSNTSIVLFGAFAALAALTNSVGPIHIAHDAAIRFLHNIELCKQLSREIAIANYASDRPARKQWADDIRKSYRLKRRVGKVALAVLFFLTVTAIIAPWLVIIYTSGGFSTALIVVAFLAPMILGHAIEVAAMIWPGKKGFRLGLFYRR